MPAPQTTEQAQIRPPRTFREWHRRSKRGAMADLYRTLRKARVPVSDSHLRNVLAGRFRPSWELAVHISAATGVPVENLMKASKALRRKLSGVAA